MKLRKYTSKLDSNKEWFIKSMKDDGYNIRTVKNFENFMHRIRHYELKWVDGKTIENFNYNEFITMLESLGSGSQESLTTYMNMINRYLTFCKTNGLIDDRIDYARTIDYSKVLSCVDKGKHKLRYITSNKVMDIVDGFINYQDKVLFLLIYEGIKGVENRDIINLRKQDVDFDNKTITVTDKKGNQIVRNISDELTETILEALSEKEYYLDNEIGDKVDNVIGGDYVIRPTENYLNMPAVQEQMELGLYDGKRIQDTILTNRFHKLCKKYSDTPYLTQTTLYRSGVINRAIEKYGMDATKMEFANYCVEHEGMSLAMSYKLYVAFEEIVSQLNDERMKEEE